MKIILYSLLNFLALTATCQVPVSELNAQEKKCFETFNRVADFFKTYRTIPLPFHRTENYSKEEAFYDTVITMFFSREKMLRMFEKNTTHFAVAGKMDWMRHTLNEVDYLLDVIPTDSIFVRPNNLGELLDTLELYLIVDNEEVPLYLWNFDSLNALLAGVSTGAIQEHEAFMLYLRRQKIYYEFPDPKRGVTINQ